MLLEKIQKENDIKQLKPEELEKLAVRRNKVVGITCGFLLYTSYAAY